MTDSIKVVKFDPNNPEEWKPIPWYEINKLSKKDQELYEKEQEKRYAWEKAERIKMEQLPREFPEGYGNTAKTENAMILELGNALKKEGFEIVYTTGTYHSEAHTIHESWAARGIIKKDEQNVGHFIVWKAGSWRARPIGWKIVTNRGKGSNPRAWNSEEKRLKNLQNAVKYIKETAIPRAEVEDELDKAEGQLERMASASHKARLAANLHKKGLSGSAQYRKDDGTLSDIMDAMYTGDAAKAMQLVAEHYKRYEELTWAAAAMEEREAEYRNNVVKPLREKAKEERPEVYS
jgi:hypothetical protein